MFKISDFSKFTRVSVKMLRHYDEIGLLKPAQVDPFTGYRYYSADQLPRLNRIILLKDLGFTLGQISDLLDGDLTLEQIKGMLKLRQAEIEQQIRMETLRLEQIETHLLHVEQETQRPRYDVILREVSSQLIASIRQTVPTLGQPISQLFDEVEAYAAVHHARAISSPLTVFHDVEYREENMDVEVAVPLTQQIPDSDRVTVGELPGTQTMACVVYTGDYDKTTEVLNAVMIWLEGHHYTIEGPMREVYLRFGADHVEELNLPRAFLTDNPQLFVTEIQFPVIKENS